MNNQICSAIKERKILQFNYDGGIREVEPFCYGEGTSGNELLRGYQISGYSESGNSTGWKLFKASEISNLTVSNKIFDKPRDGYNPKDSAMSKIYCNF